MKLSEAVEIMEKNPIIKQKVIEQCTQEMGDKLTIKFVVWNDYGLANQDEFQNPTELKRYQNKSLATKFEYEDTRNEHSIYEEIIKDAGLNEYNDNIIAMQILEGYKVYEITQGLNIRMDKYESIKAKIYDAIKKREQE